MGESAFGDCPIKEEMTQKVIADIGADGFMYCCPQMKAASRWLQRKLPAFIWKSKKKKWELKPRKSKKKLKWRKGKSEGGGKGNTNGTIKVDVCHDT